MLEVTGPAVRFGTGHRPETATHVQLAAWEGPLGLLLSLIEARRLDVLRVPLGGLADRGPTGLGIPLDTAQAVRGSVGHVSPIGGEQADFRKQSGGICRRFC